MKKTLLLATILLCTCNYTFAQFDYSKYTLKYSSETPEVVNYQPEGFRLWGTKNQELYSGNSSKWLSPDVVSQKGISEYLRPLQVNASSAAYNGYTFPKPHYLDPIPVGEFLLVISPDGVTPTSAGMSVLYQNPGWPVNADGPADSNYDCD